MMDGITLTQRQCFLRKSNVSSAHTLDAERCVDGKEYLDFNRKTWGKMSIK